MKLFALFVSFHPRMISQENIGSEFTLIERNLCGLSSKIIVYKLRKETLFHQCILLTRTCYKMLKPFITQRGQSPSLKMGFFPGHRKPVKIARFVVEENRLCSLEESPE